MTLETTIRSSPDQVSCNLEDQIAILNLKTGIYFGLDAVGALVWKLIAERPRTAAELRDEILRHFDVDAGTCEADLFRLLDHMAAERLIETGTQSKADPRAVPESNR